MIISKTTDNFLQVVRIFQTAEEHIILEVGVFIQSDEIETANFFEGFYGAWRMVSISNAVADVERFSRGTYYEEGYPDTMREISVEETQKVLSTYTPEIAYKITSMMTDLGILGG